MNRNSVPPNALSKKFTSREFLFYVRDVLKSRLSSEFDNATSRIIFSSLQWHYGDPRLHYELALVRKIGRTEIGLHMEGSHEWSRAVAVRLADHSDEIRSSLGFGYELEEWTASWCRLHQTVPLERLTDSFADEVSGYFSTLIENVEPIVRSLDLSDLSTTSTRGRKRLRWN